jgi:hypothetical protein
VIPFTQYLRPSGNPKSVSFTVEHEDYEATVIASELVTNGPTVLPAVDRLITEAHRIWTTREKATVAQ